MKKTFAVLMLCLSGCATDPDDARKAVSALGMTNVQTGSVAMFGCSEDDWYGRRFTATNAAGQSVSGIVCCGTFKGCTVRF